MTQAMRTPMIEALEYHLQRLYATAAANQVPEEFVLAHKACCDCVVTQLRNGTIPSILVKVLSDLTGMLMAADASSERCCDPANDVHNAMCSWQDAIGINEIQSSYYFIH